ncbi:MAG TPA: phosphoglycerate dehydrogenase [Thermoplasmatales archaeon]|nr:phosphoglycerate dehydrogenase [Thermoplasmatales archaeon]HEX17355.1 phosphoglycerate dehydrogenase [Thermoplasmatales archaeon]
MKVLITDKLADEAIELLKREGFDTKYEELDHDALLQEIADYDALIVRSRTKVTADIIEKGAKGKLKVIGRAGIGVDNIDVDKATELGIKVVNAPTGSTISVAELTIAHMLALARSIPKADSSMKKGEWIKKQLKGIELHGKTLGLIGSGRIAQHVARIAKGLGMNILVYSPHCTDEKARKMGARRATLEEVLREADFVSLHIPKTKDTYHLIDREKLSLMKRTAYLINCARGGVVDEEALYEVLRDGRIAGAAIDVFEEEPPKGSKLLDLDNVVLTPHIGANTTEAQIRAGTICAEQVIKVLRGEEPEFWVNKR